MDKMMSVTLMVMMLGVFIESSQAVQCYNCSRCDEPTDATCNGDVCAKVSYTLNGVFVVRRYCSPRAHWPDGFGCNQDSFRNVTGEICGCDTDLCNMAPMTSSFGHVIAVVVLIIGVIIAHLK